MVLFEKLEIDDSKIQRYKFNKLKVDDQQTVGLLICYQLATHKNIDFVSLNIDFVSDEIGVDAHREYVYTKEMFNSIFQSVYQFIKAFDDDNFGWWKLLFEYDGIELQVIGERDESDIRIFHNKDIDVEIFDLLLEIENSND